MKKRLISALLALALILSNFTGGGLIEHVHVEAVEAELVNPVTLHLHLYNDYHKEIVISHAGVNTFDIDLTDINGGTMDTFELSNSNSWNHGAGQWDSSSIGNLPVGTVIESSVKFDEADAELSEKVAKYTYDGKDRHLDIPYYAYFEMGGTVYVNEKNISNWEEVKGASKVTLTLNVILPEVTEPKDFSAPNNKLYLFVGDQDANSSVEITDYKDQYELSFTAPNDGVKDITDGSWLTIKSVSNVQSTDSTSIPETAAIDVTKVVITDDAGEVHTYEEFVKDVLTNDMTPLKPYRTVKGQDGLFVISILDKFAWTPNEQHIVDMVTKIKSVTVYFNVVNLSADPSACPNGNNHSEEGWKEVDVSTIEYAIDGWCVPLNDGDIVYAGDTVDYCFSSESDKGESLRFYLNNTVNSSNNALSGPWSHTLSKGSDGTFSQSGTITDTSAPQPNGHTANYFKFRDTTGAEDNKLETTTEALKFTHFCYRIHHTHSYTENDFDGINHWKACVCGDIQADSLAKHSYTTETDGSRKCECGYTHVANETDVVIDDSLVIMGNGIKVVDGAIIIEGVSGQGGTVFAVKLPAPLEAMTDTKIHITFESKGNTRFRLSSDGTDNGGTNDKWVESYTSSGNYDVTFDYQNNNEGQKGAYLLIKATWSLDSSTIIEYAKITHIGVVYPVHDHEYEYAHDLTTHWGQCTVCGMVQDPEPHDEACATPGTACSKCGFVHPLGEQAIDIKDQTKFKAENGELTFADGSLTLSGGYIKVTLPRKLVKDDTIILHLVGNSSDPKVRYWIPTNGDQGPAADEYNGTVGTDDSTAIAVNGAFDITFPERTLTADASDVLTIKYNYNGTNITLTHIGIVIPECPHNTQEEYYEWKHNEKEHWQECKLCGDKKPAEPHNSDAADGSCDKCGFKEKHPEGEEKAAITQESITVNGDKVTVADGVITVTECNDFIIKLPKAIPVGDTVTVHIIGTLNSKSGLRFRLLEDNNTNSVVRTDWFSPNASGYFTFTQEYTLKSTDGSNKGTPIAGNYIEVKANAGAQENFDLSITHIAIVYGKHNFKDEWTYDNTHHWHDCSDEGCEVKSDYGVHTYSEEKPGVCASCNRPHGDDEHNYENGKCTVCYYVHEAHTPVPGSYKSAGNDNHTYTCSVCKATVTEAHEKGELVNTDPNKHWTSCNKCDAHIDEAAHSLEYGKDDSQHWQSCKTCGYESSHVNHVWVEGKPSKEPSHTEEGLRTDSCECGATKDVTLPADKDAHTWGDWTVGTAPTLEDGGTVKRSCTENDGGEEQKSVPALSDTSEWDVEHTEAADCTKTGLDTYTSKTYGVKVTVEIEKTPHSFTTKYGSDDTQHWLICDNCGEIGEKTEHSAGAGAKYTDNADGDTHSYTCSVCGEKVNEKHTVTKKYDTDNHWDYCDKCKYEGETKPHTGYAKKDSISHSVDCPDCDYQNSSEAHTPGSDWVYDEEANARYHICDKCGDKCDLAYHSYVYKDDGNGTTHHQECATCHHVKANSTVAHNYQNGVCKDCNYTHPEEAHVWGEGWKPDTGGTTHSRKCTVCGKTETKPHGYPENWTPVEGGKQHSKTCEDCGKTVSEDHSYGGWTNVNETTHKHSCECGYEETATHNFGTGFDNYRTDSINHWQVCSDCQGQSAKVNHSYPEGEDHCSVCNYWNHQHKMVWMDDGQNHWQECSDPDCNHKTDKEPHGSSEYTYNSTQHVKTCPTCKATIAEDHILVYDKNELGHWQKCTVCEYESHSSAHNYTDVSDASEHWKICDTCKYETEHAAHTPKSELGRNETQHWSICSECGKDYNYSEHTPSSDLRHDAEGHWNYCTECGYENTASKSNHNWDNGIVVKPATETDEGLKKFTCTECDETKTESIPKLSHTHVPGEEWKHDETSHWHECVSETCDDRSAKLEEAAHIEDGGIVTKEATELEEGTMTYKCTVCGRVLRTEAIEKLAHTHVPGEEWKHDETSHWHECVSETCDDRNAKLEEAAHIEDGGIVTKEATELEEGTMTYKCTVCGRVLRTEAIEKLTHTHVPGEEWKHDETSHWHECVSEACDDPDVQLEKAEHQWDDGVVTSEPTYTKEGEKLFTCGVCKATKVEKIPVNSHEHETVMKSDANGHWNECTICGETVGEVEAHTPGDWITDSEATSTLPGKRHKECTVCGYVTDTLEIPATGDIDVEVPTVGNVPKVEIPSEQQEALKNAVITEEDVDAIENGASIDIDLTVENADRSIDPDTKAKVDSKTEEGGYKHISYLEISLTKTTTDVQGRETQEEINELGREIRIVIAIPSQYIRNSRSFAVIRVHDGVVDILNDLDSDPNTVTISTGLFSSYTLVYADSQPSPGTPGGLIGHAHIITDIRHDSEYHWRGCFLCSMRVDVARHNFVNGVCPICGYRDPDYVPGEDDEAPVEASDDIVNVVAPAQEAEQGGDPEETPEVTDTPADLPTTEMEVVEVKEDDETSENPKTGVIFTGIGAVMAAIAALIAKRK